MNIGDVALMKKCNVSFGKLEFGFKAKNSRHGDRLVFVFLGSHNDKNGDFDVDKALIDLGWTPPHDSA